MQGTDNIIKYLQAAYSDQNLSDLLAHAESGRLAYRSCCCFIGIPTAKHALRGYMTEFEAGEPLGMEFHHHGLARLSSATARLAEAEFMNLGRTDAARREAIIPLVKAEMDRRQALSEDLPAVFEHAMRAVSA